jgi:K+-transporting ATPase ATPase C chain
LIGQSFTDPKYFWSRPSATSPQPYNSASSSGSNLGPTNPALLDAVKERVGKFEQRPVPADLVTASGSGLDPHLSPAAAEYQIPRISKTRNIPEDRLRELVAKYTEGRQLGILGEPRVNVLELNLALDAQR